MKVSQRNGFIDRESYVAQYLALAIFTIGVASTIGSDDLLAAFAAGKPANPPTPHSHPNAHPQATYSPCIILVR